MASLPGVTLAFVILVRPSAPARAPSLFPPLASVSSSSAPVSSAPPSVSSSSRPTFSSCSFAFAPPDPSSFSFGLSDDIPQDALPRVFDPVSASALPESALSEFRRMMSFIVDLFPQAAGSPSVPLPPRALFEDFFSSSSSAYLSQLV